MPSPAHQHLLLWGVRRMLSDGFLITGIDGRVGTASGLSCLPCPIPVRGVRPDACGVHGDEGLLAFAEAKTAHDVDNVHTRAQLRILGHARMRESKAPCPLYIAVPRASAYALDRVLRDVGLLGARHVRRIHVPDVLFG